MATVCVGVVVTGGAVAVKVYEVARGPEASQIERPAPEIIGTPYAGPEAQFYVVGNAARPASYRLQGEMTLTQALTLAGLSADAADSAGKRIEIIRWAGEKDETIARMMAADLFTGKEADRFLQPNDVINVGLPPAVATMPNVVGTPFGGGVAEIYVMGRVSRAGVYPLGKEFTLKEALAQAGLGADGINVDGQRVDLIRRVGEKGETTARAVVVDLLVGKVADLYLQPNDVINVGIAVAGEWDIMGMVARPGVYAMGPADRVSVKEAITRAGLLVDAKTDVSVCLLRRTEPVFEAMEEITLGAGLTGAAGDREVMVNDVLIVTPKGMDLSRAFGYGPSAATQAAAEKRPAVQVTGTPAQDGEYTVTGIFAAQGSFSLRGRPITVMQALTSGLGEGYLWPNQVYIKRASDGKTLGWPGHEVLMGLKGDWYVQPGDEIVVESTYDAIGAGLQNGTYLLHPGMTVQEALQGEPQAGNLRADEGVGISRLDATGKYTWRKLDVGPGWTGPDAAMRVWAGDRLNVYKVAAAAGK